MQQEIDSEVTLYDLNKDLVKKHEIKLSNKAIEQKKKLIINFLNNINDSYYMLLCNERRDYTIFTFKNKTTKEYQECADILINECLFNRGELRGFDLTRTKDAIEIWMIIEDDAFVYYFFPYGNAIIEIGDEN